MSEETEDVMVRGNRGRLRGNVRSQAHAPSRDAHGNKVVTGRNGEQLTRSRRSGTDPFQFPQNFVPDGWEYQWCAEESLGNKEIMRTMMLEYYQNGWRPVPAERHDGYFLPLGEKGPIQVRGCMLMERPKEMCDEARAEEKANAIRQMQDRNDALMGGKANFGGHASGQGIPVRGTGDSRGTAVRMAIDPALDIGAPQHTIIGPGEE